MRHVPPDPLGVAQWREVIEVAPDDQRGTGDRAERVTSGSLIIAVSAGAKPGLPKHQRDLGDHRRRDPVGMSEHEREHTVAQPDRRIAARVVPPLTEPASSRSALPTR